MRDVAKFDETDFVPCPNLPGCFLANDIAFVGYVIDRERIANWSLACQGQFEAEDPNHRDKFYEAGTSLVLLSFRRLRGTGSLPVPFGVTVVICFGQQLHASTRTSRRTGWSI
jgi:hypothetical protein